MTTLVPVDQWVWNLYRVDYMFEEEGPVRNTRYIVASCEPHLVADIEESWPSNSCQWYRWELVAENVPAPRTVGSYYGMPLCEGGIAAGCREAEARGLR